MLKTKHFIKMSLILLSLSLVAAGVQHEGKRKRPNLAKIFSDEEKTLLKSIHQGLRTSFESGDEELREVMRKLRGPRPKFARRNPPQEVLEFIKSDRETRLAKLSQIHSLVEELRQAKDFESSQATIEKLAPMLKMLPPPPPKRFRDGNCRVEESKEA